MQEPRHMITHRSGTEAGVRGSLSYLTQNEPFSSVSVAHGLPHTPISIDSFGDSGKRTLCHALSSFRSHVHSSVWCSSPCSFCTLSSTHRSMADAFHVTTGGSASGSGSITDPWTLSHALSHPAQVAPGDTIWVHEGVYSGSFVSNLLGTASRPIVVRNYRGGRATLEDRTGGILILTARGGYTWFWGLEVRSVSTNLTNTSGVILGAPGIKCINMVVHDCLGSGINPFKEAIDAEVYGSLMYFNGRQNERSGGAYGSYIQNVTGRKLIRDNIYHHNWSYGVHAYESGGADLDSMTFEGNAIFNNGLFYEANKFRANLFLGGDDVHTADDNVFRNNYTYYPPTPSMNQMNAIGHVAGARNLTMEGNFWVSPGYCSMDLNSVNNKITENVFFGWMLGIRSSDYPSNAYYSSWPSRPDDIFVRPNVYEAGRGHIIAYNWDGSPSIEVDISTILDPGVDYVIKDALNFYGPEVMSGTYAGGKIAIPLSGLTPARPEGTPVTGPVHTAPQFAVFIVLARDPESLPPKTGVGDSPSLPRNLTLMQNYPNPFNPTTTIEFELSVASSTEGYVVSTTGVRVADLVSEKLAAGRHRIHWNADGLSSGTYFLVLRAAGERLTRKMLLLR